MVCFSAHLVDIICRFKPRCHDNLNLRIFSLRRYWFISTKYQQSSKLALFTFILAFVVILLGAYTRLTDAGLSCPDWPNCYGYLTAPHTPTQLQDAAQTYPAYACQCKKSLD